LPNHCQNASQPVTVSGGELAIPHAARDLAERRDNIADGQFIPPWWKKSLKELPAASTRALSEANAFSTSALLKEFNACQFSRLPQLTQ
jgi:hypothetical protein